MEHCRSLKFESDPDYKYLISLFDKCMKRNNLDPTLMDFTWKQNRLSKDKELLKSSMMDVIKKKAKAGEQTGGNDSLNGNPGLTSAMNTGMGQAGGAMMGM